ncbi:hypothetical protein HPP92_009985 [Vanilla planifolia]|uniref:SWIM-type domain-containing protein n=1 Tax=Vanilla planifolia TaxID=51239 RepID=A0A835V3M4_VANPL|nr:hypothetical protein HPP92_010144 [Vanilla planifolia]KAG0481901.1 hypothetical protein HPP92_009985 [Vanilla planifolia]
MSASSAIVAVAESVWRQIRLSRSVSDDHLAILHFLFGKNLERATTIVDQSGIGRVFGKPSGRVVFKVVGESRKEDYICFPEHFCTCQSFFFDVVNKGEQLYCKHQIAALLAEAVGACNDVSIPDEELAMMLIRI